MNDSTSGIASIEIGTGIAFLFKLFDPPILVHNLSAPYGVKSSAGRSLYQVTPFPIFFGHGACVSNVLYSLAISKNCSSLLTGGRLNVRETLRRRCLQKFISRTCAPREIRSVIPDT
jgi:hypothetical protein